MKPIYKIIIALIIIACAGGIYYKSRQRLSFNRPNQGKSIEELMKARKQQAEKSIQSPIGQAFIAKDWNKVKTLYQPKTQFMDWAELIRSAYIENLFQKFNSADLDQVTQITLETLKTADEQTALRMALLSNQFVRLPIPSADSATYQEIVKTALSGSKDPASSFAARNCLLKLIQQDQKPDARIMKLFYDGFAGNTLGLNRGQWIRSAGSIRNLEFKKQSMKNLIRDFARIPADGQASALVTLSLFPEEGQKEIAKIMIKALKDENPVILDAALRGTFAMIQKQAISGEDKKAMAKVLSSMPANNLTPFARTKIKEILPMLNK